MCLSPLLEIQNLHLSFATDYGISRVLCGVDLSIAPGETLALVGESGSGKSMTAQAILQLFGPSASITEGTIHFKEKPLHNKTAKEMRAIRGKEIGMIFQDPLHALNPTLTVGTQISETLRLHKQLSRQEARRETISLLQQVGIADAVQRYDAYPFQLSGGMRQRVCIAMAIACRPALLIADEPTTALDATIQSQILQLLKQVQKESGMSLLLITHDLGVVASLCDRAAVMNRGKIVEVGSVDEIFYAPKHPYTQTLIKS